MPPKAAKKIFGKRMGIYYVFGNFKNFGKRMGIYYVIYGNPTLYLAVTYLKIRFCCFR